MRRHGRGALLRERVSRALGCDDVEQPDNGDHDVGLPRRATGSLTASVRSAKWREARLEGFNLGGSQRLAGPLALRLLPEPHGHLAHPAAESATRWCRAAHSNIC